CAARRRRAVSRARVGAQAAAHRPRSPARTVERARTRTSQAWAGARRLSPAHSLRSRGPMSIWIGIDIAKATLAVHVHPEGRFLSLPNSAEGYAELLARLAGRSVGNVLLEATGGYERPVMRALADAGLPVTRINPRRARAFAHALGKTAKTDPID